MGIAEEIDALKNNALAMQEAVAKADQEQREKLEALRARIKAGESSGDRLRDFALACWNDTFDGLVARAFQGVQGQLQGKIGQLAMIVEFRLRSSTVDDGPGSSFHNDEVATVRIGFLSDDQLHIDLKSSAWGLPCHNHVEYGAVNGFITGCICFNDKRTTLSSVASSLGMLDVSYGRRPDVVVGDEAVTAWLSTEPSMRPLLGESGSKDAVLRYLTKLTLELRVPEGHRLEQERLSLRDESFNDALHLESFIAEKRFALENNPGLEKLGMSFTTNIVKEIRAFITSLGEKFDLAIKLGIEQNHPDILRLRKNFGHYWKT